jgi:hypothetical protein
VAARGARAEPNVNRVAAFRKGLAGSSADIELLPLVSVVMQSMASIWGGDAGPI